MKKLKEILSDINQELPKNPTPSLFINTLITIFSRIYSVIILIGVVGPFGLLELIYYIYTVFETIFAKSALKVLTEHCENVLKEQGELKFQGLELSDETIHTGLEYFLKYKFFNVNGNSNTLFTSGIYIDRVQTYRNRRRSIGDICCICKYYYPNCTPVEVYKILDAMSKIRYIGGSYCNTIHKFVYHTQHFDFNTDSKLEYSKLRYSQFSKKILK